MEFNSDIFAKLEKLDIDRLVNVALTDKDIVLELFKRKYADRTIEFINGDPRKKTQISEDKIVINHQMAEPVLKLFGHLITTTIIVNFAAVKPIQSKKTIEHIGNYCAKLVNLVFVEFNANPLHDIQSSFPSVNVVYFMGTSATFGMENYKLNTIFPNIKQLFLLVRGVSDQSCIDLEYPHLEHLSTAISHPKLASFDESTIKEVLKKNPQIRSVEFELVSQSFLKVVNQYLPELEVLRVTALSGEIDYFNGIRFANVKKLSLKAVDDKIPSNIVFNQLEKVVFDSHLVISKQ